MSDLQNMNIIDNLQGGVDYGDYDAGEEPEDLQYLLSLAYSKL